MYDSATISHGRFAWSEARAGEVSTLVVRAYDFPSRHLFKAVVAWDGRWMCTRSPQALRSGGRRVDEGLAEAFEAEALRLFGMNPDEYRRQWLSRLERTRSGSLDAERRLLSQEASLLRKRRELLDDSIRYEWETRRAFRRIEFPVERAVTCKVQGENRRVTCRLDPRFATMGIEGDGVSVEVRLDGQIEATGLDLAAVRRLVRFRVRRAFEGYGYFFSAVDLEWALTETDSQLRTLRMEIEALGDSVLTGFDLLARTPAHDAEVVTVEGIDRIPWSDVTPLDATKVRVVAHDLASRHEISGIVERTDEGWVASVVDLRHFAGDGTPVRSDDGGHGAVLTLLAEAYASGNPEAMALAGERVSHRTDLMRRMEERRVDARLEELRAQEEETIARAMAILKEILDERSKTSFPASWFYAGSHVELRVTASGDEPLAHVVVESPLEFTWEGGKAMLRPGFAFNLEGDIEFENPDFATLDGAGRAWSLWTTQMRRDAIAAISALIVRSAVGREIEALLLVQAAKELRRERDAIRQRAGLAESEAAA